MGSKLKIIASTLLILLMLLPAVPGVYASYPVAVATVTITGDNGFEWTTTGTDGTFALNNLLAAGNYTLSVFASGYLEKEVDFTINAGETTNLGDILLGESATIQGTVTGPSSEPVPALYVMLRRSSDNSTVDTTNTDSNGNYEFNKLVATGSYNIWFFTSGSGGNGYMDKHILGVAATEGETTAVINAQLERSAWISGTAMISPSTPLAGAMIKLYDVDNSKTIAYLSTDAQGKYNRSYNLPAGTYRVSVQSAPGAVYSAAYPIQITVAAGGHSSDNDFMMQRSATISGRVTYTDGAPVPYATPSSYNYDTYQTSSVSADEGGYYTINYGLEVGENFVYVNANYQHNQTVNITSGGQAITGINFVIPRPGPYGYITGHVYDTSLTLMPGIIVTASGDSTFFGYTGEDGTYTMEIDMSYYGSPMSFEVSADETGYYGYSIQPIVVDNGETEVVNLELTKMPTGSVSGRIVSAQPHLQATTMTIGSSASQGQVGTPFTLTANCSAPVDAIASFMWSINGSGFGNGTSVNMYDGHATFQFTPWAPGVHQFFVRWFGDSEYSESTSGTTTINVVQPPPKQNATLTIQTSSNNVTAGTILTIFGTITPSQTGQISIFRSINGSSFTQIGAATLSSGAYSYQTAIAQPGSYSFYTQWAGSDQYYSSTSQSQISVTSNPLPVQKTTPVVTISLSKTTVVLDSTHTSDTITVTGTMTPFIPGTTIHIMVTNPSNQVNDIPLTPASSSFTAQVVLDSLGSWTVQVTVPEGVDYNPASSNSVVVSAQAPSDNTAVYIGAGIAVAAGVAIAAVFMMKKKPAK